MSALIDGRVSHPAALFAAAGAATGAGAGAATGAGAGITCPASAGTMPLTSRSARIGSG